MRRQFQLKNKTKLLASPYTIWAVGFILIPLVLVLYYAFTSKSGGFTLENIISITDSTNSKALVLSILLS